jgi:hypothetical protein
MDGAPPWRVTSPALLAIRRTEGALGAIFSPCSLDLCRVTTPLNLFRYRSANGIELWIGVAHRLRQHGAKLIFGGRLRLNIWLEGNAHHPNWGFAEQAEGLHTHRCHAPRGCGVRTGIVPSVHGE